MSADREGRCEIITYSNLLKSSPFIGASLLYLGEAGLLKPL